MPNKLELASAILSRFRGRENYVAACKPGEHFKPHELKAPLTPKQFVKTHFGDTCLGFYLLREDNRIRCSAVDFDNHSGENPEATQKALGFAQTLFDLGLDPLVEVSQSGRGGHVWLFYEHPVSAVLVRKFLGHQLEAQGLQGTEIYPRQDELDSRTPLGNLIRYPLFGESHFLGLDGNRLNPSAALNDVSFGTEDEIDNLISWDADDTYSPELTDQGLPVPVEHLIRQYPSSLLAIRWAGDTTGMYDPSRSSLVQSFVLELVRQYIHPEDIKAAIAFWCEQNGYSKGLRDRWQERTISKAYDIVSNRIQKTEKIEDDTFAGIATEYLKRLLFGDDPVVSTGIAGLDESIEGFGLGEFTVLAGRPGDGKTALAIQLLEQAAMAGHAGLYFSLEMGPLKTAKRLITRIANRPKNEWGDYETNQQLMESVERKYRERKPVYFVENQFDIEDIENTIREYVAEKNVRVVVVDYQQLATAGHDSEYTNQTEVSKRLKMITNELQIAMIDLVMMKREIDLCPHREPVLADIKGTGQLEQDSDLILFTRRPSVWDEDAEPDDYLVYVKKCRNRECMEDRVEMKYDMNRQEFY